MKEWIEWTQLKEWRSIAEEKKYKGWRGIFRSLYTSDQDFQEKSLHLKHDSWTPSKFSNMSMGLK